MMRNKTYRNVIILTHRIQKKGYDFEESSKMALRCFDESNYTEWELKPSQTKL